jgi:hypothetical protein
MSGINGDKDRFHRERKKKIAKRQRTRELLKLAKKTHVHNQSLPPNDGIKYDYIYP